MLEYYSAFKRKEILTHAATWMDCESIMPSEIGQTQKDNYCMIALKWGKPVRFTETKRRMVVPGAGWGEDSCYLMGAPKFCSNSCPLSWWCQPTISSFAALFSSCLQSLPASGTIPMNWFFASDGQSLWASVSASVFTVNIQGWFPLGLTGLIFLLSKGPSRVISSTTVWKLSSMLSFLYGRTLTFIYDYWKNHSLD